MDNPHSGAAGIYQFTPGTWSAYGNGSDPHDVAANVDAGVRLMRDNRAALERSLGRLPSAGEVYLAHQQGHAGASALLSNPDGNAAQVLATAYHGNVAKAAAAITANGGDPDGTAGQFAHKWTSAVDGHAPMAADGGSGFTPRTVSYSDLMAPPGDQFGVHDTAPAKGDDASEPFLDTMQDTGRFFATNNLTVSALRRAALDPSFAPDPNFAPTSDDVKAYATGPDGTSLPPEYLSRFASATVNQQGVRPLIGSEVGPRQKALKDIPNRYLAAAERGSASEPIKGPEPRRSTPMTPAVSTASHRRSPGAAIA